MKKNTNATSRRFALLFFVYFSFFLHRKTASPNKDKGSQVIENSNTLISFFSNGSHFFRILCEVSLVVIYHLEEFPSRFAVHFNKFCARF